MILIVFFFYRSGSHRDLHVLTHSFPTRRSSDLWACCASTWRTGRIAKMNALAVFVALLFGAWLWGVWGMLLCVPANHAQNNKATKTDRKSTRLNSSH